MVTALCANYVLIMCAIYAMCTGYVSSAAEQILEVGISLKIRFANIICMFNGSKIAVVVPAFNEENNLGRVLFPPIGSCADMIIIVDDGSTDGTRSIAESFRDRHGNGRMEVIAFDENKGKGAALVAGFKSALKTGADFVITLDADLLNLEAAHIRQMAAGMQRNPESEMGIAQVHESGSSETLFSFSGQRIFTARFIKSVLSKPYWENTLMFGKFGVERFLNYLCLPIGMKRSYDSLEFLLLNAFREPNGQPLRFCMINLSPRLEAQQPCKKGLDQLYDLEHADNILTNRLFEARRKLDERRQQRMSRGQGQLVL